MTNSTDQSTVEQTNVTNQTSSNERKDEPLVTGEYGPYTGNCKWFNNHNHNNQIHHNNHNKHNHHPLL